ncbi:MAG: class I SAM-dependent methyltransferase [Cellvibrionaceae bacterium]
MSFVAAEKTTKWCKQSLVMAVATLASAVALAGPGHGQDKGPANVSQSIQAAVKSELRTPENVQRDDYRHPAETLSFFEVDTSDHVVEIWPGGGWYSEVLAGVIGGHGKLYAAHFAKDTDIGYFQRSRAGYLAMIEAKPELYKSVEVTEFYPPGKVSSGPAASADHVLTFRNVHNWMKAGYAEQAFQEFFTLLKPGGILGVVEHRAKPGTSLEAMIKSGYVTEAKVIELATEAGFVLDAKSEVNANPKDSADHPKGVWTLPPRLRLGDEKKEHYLAIGESDRMTLKFKKPN